MQVAPRMAYFADVRVLDVDAPDCAGERARVGDLVRDLLEGANRIQVLPTGFDGFGRWLADVRVDGLDLTSWLKDRGLTAGALCPN